MSVDRQGYLNRPATSFKPRVAVHLSLSMLFLTIENYGVRVIEVLFGRRCVQRTYWTGADSISVKIIQFDLAFYFVIF